MPSIDPELWKRASPYLDRALELSAEERAAWLESFRVSRPDLAGFVDGLLKEHSEATEEHFLERSPISPAEFASEGRTGQSVGPYRLMAPIGEGGMGSVWLAERSDGRFERRVAIKFVRLALGTRGAAERFAREGKIVGQLTHPHIAELIDAGIGPAGEPYLVLEYVDGQPINEYCDQGRLPVDARLRLFLDVLDAIAVAHAQLIVHSDIKPSNVLVRNDGQVKLLDFGIAKLLADTETPADATLITRDAGAALTPRFAAPEQLTGKRITTATDVYALGVLLYLLLSGEHPAGSEPHSTAELVKAITEIEPSRASDVVASAGTASAAEKRGSTRQKLRRELRGDLDTILGKALKKNPRERYASVHAFGDDLLRYLRHEPISARPDTMVYRARKFVRRKRAMVALITGTVMLVISSLSAGLYLANRQRGIAERRFAQVRQLANKFIALDNDIRGLPGSTKVRMQIVSDSLQYLTSLGSDVHGDKDLALEIAYAYVRVAHAQGDPTSPNLGQFAEAEASLGKAATFVDSVLKTDPNNRRALFIATTIAHDRMVLADTRGDLAERLSYAGSAAALIERFLGTRPGDPGDLYGMRYFSVNVADAYYEGRDFDSAIRHCQRALEISLPAPHANDLRGGILGVLASARWQSGDLEGALKTVDEAVTLEKAEAAGGHASLRINLANGYDLQGMILGRQDAEPSLGRSLQALADFQKALAIAEDLSQRDPNDYLGRHSVVTASLEIGNILRHQNPQEALAVYDHALVRIREAPSSAGTERDEAELLTASSYALRWAGRNQKAKQCIARAFELLAEAGLYPADKVEPMGNTYDVLRAQADDYAEAGRPNEAIKAYQKLLDKLIAWKLDPQNDLRDATCISRTWTALASLLRRTGRNDEAHRLEAQRTELWDHWNSKLPNALFLLRQSLRQVSPRGAKLALSRGY